MAFDVNSLFNNPAFVTGLSLFGASNKRHSGLQEAAALLQAMNAQRSQQEIANRNYDLNERQFKDSQQRWNTELPIKQAQAQRDEMAVQVQQQQLDQRKAEWAQRNRMIRGFAPLLEKAYPGLKIEDLIGPDPSSSQAPGMSTPDGPMGPPAPTPNDPLGLDAQVQPVPAQSRAHGEPLPPAVAPVPQAPQPTAPATQPVQQPVAAQPSPVDQLFMRVLQVESQDRQFKPNGATVLGPVTRTGAQAVGRSQVMPSTGPEAAKLAGLPWDEKRLYTDPQYNAALGKAYFTKQMQDFGGDPHKASAAYNAGPEAVKRAVAFAESSGRPDMWTSLLPKETQEYINKVAGPYQPPPRQRFPTDAAGTPVGLPPFDNSMQVAGAALNLVTKDDPGDALIQLGKAMEPRTYPAGVYVQGPDGKVMMTPDPKFDHQRRVDEIRIEQEDTRIGQKAAEIGHTIQKDAADIRLRGKEDQRQDRADTRAQETHDREAEAKATAARQARAKEAATVGAVIENAGIMFNKTNELINHPGGPWISGPAFGKAPEAVLVGRDQSNAMALYKSITAQNFIDTIMSMKAASETGATGMGQLNIQEGQRLEQAKVAIDRAQDWPTLQRRLKEYQVVQNNIRNRTIELYEKTYGAHPVPGFPLGARFMDDTSKRGYPLVKLPDGTVMEAVPDK